MMFKTEDIILGMNIATNVGVIYKVVSDTYERSYSLLNVETWHVNEEFYDKQTLCNALNLLGWRLHDS